MHIDSSLAAIKGLTKTQREILQKMKIETIKDLIFCFPTRHEDFSAIVPLARAGDCAQVTVVARVKAIKNRRSFRRRMVMTEAQIEDGSGTFMITWFGSPYVTGVIKAGETYRFAGKIGKSRFGTRLINPLFERIEVEDGATVDDAMSDGKVLRVTAPFLPVYSLPAGLSQYMMRKLVRGVATVFTEITDPLTAPMREQYDVIPLGEALRTVHFPVAVDALTAAKKRLAFDEMLKIQLAVGKTKKWRVAQRAPCIALNEQAMKDFVTSLPFALTRDQRVAAWEAVQDMKKPQPMYRLLDGDVGSGKTVVAAIAMVNAVASEYQSSVMAPTEILARQHYLTLKKFFARRVGAAEIRVALWTSAYKQSFNQKKEIICTGTTEADLLRQEIADGAVDIVIGTHALLEDAMQFHRLGLAVIDEQHRFGVRARQVLATKSGMPGLLPHFLSMTATPIPRSFALTVFGDLDLSLLKEKPAERLPIITKMIHPNQRHVSYQHICKEIAEGRQAFIICPLIDESETLEVASVIELAERLRKEEFVDIAVGVLHGKLAPEEKEKIMNDFAQNRLAVVVATSVVEVGIDIPNATIMCIEGAERFGLAQLHQFRGRVGRGSSQSFCYLLPTVMTPHVKERLGAVVELNDGFAIAEKDLALRGPGDMFGVAQTGFPELRFASITDMALIHDAREAAAEMLADDELLAKEIVTRDVTRAHLE